MFQWFNGASLCLCVCVSCVCRIELGWHGAPSALCSFECMETYANIFIEIIRHQHVATMFIPRSDLQVTEGSAAGNIAIVLKQFSILGVPDGTTLADMKQSLRLSTVDSFIISMVWYVGAWLHTLIILSYTVTTGKCKVTLVHSQNNIVSQVRQAKPVVMESCSDVMELKC